MAKQLQSTDQEKQRALQMFMDDIAVSKIADAVGKSRTTIYNWMNDGVLTDGQDWREYRDEHEQFEVAYVGNEKLETSVEKADDFWDDNIPKLRRAVQRTINKMSKGEMVLGPDELDTIVSLIRKVENRGKELRMLQEEFMRKAFFAIREHVDKTTFQLIREEIKQVSLEQLKEVDEDYAAVVVDDAA